MPRFARGPGMDVTGQKLGWSSRFAFSRVLLSVAAEVLLVRKGIFAFSDQTNQLFGVATWLPWIYMAGGPAAGRFIELKGGAP